MNVKFTSNSLTSSNIENTQILITTLRTIYTYIIYVYTYSLINKIELVCLQRLTCLIWMVLHFLLRRQVALEDSFISSPLTRRGVRRLD